MSLLAICSAKGSPGVTSLAHALAAQNGALLIEADPSGGDIAARWGLPLDPGMLTLAAAARRAFTVDLIDHHTQSSPPGYPVLVAPPSAEQSRSAVLTLGKDFADSATLRPISEYCNFGPRAIADCGRWDPHGPCVGLVRAARTTLLVMRPTVESVATIRPRLTSLLPLATSVIVVTIGERPYPPDEVSDALGGVPTLAIEDDERTASLLASGRPLDRSLRRSPLVRSIQPLLEAIALPKVGAHHQTLVSR